MVAVKMYTLKKMDDPPGWFCMHAHTLNWVKMIITQKQTGRRFQLMHFTLLD